MKICLIIINYNGVKFLSRYLSRIAGACQKNDIPLIVTDDRSTDDSIVFLKSINCIYTINDSSNHGFAANVNNGIRYAKSLGEFDHFIISNNDIEIADELFPALKKAVEAISGINKKAGIIGFEEVFETSKARFESYSYIDYDPATKISEQSGIPGFFFIISNELINSIGLFDEAYFMYGEDNDYYTRALKAGFSIYSTGLPVMHYSEGSSNNSKQTSWYVYRNALLFAQKNLGAGGVIKMIFSLVNQVYNPFYKTKNPGNERVRRNGFFYNNYLLMKSIVWNLRYYLAGHNKRENK